MPPATVPGPTIVRGPITVPHRRRAASVTKSAASSVSMIAVTIAAIIADSARMVVARAPASVVIAADVGVGLGTAAFTAFIARETDPRYTATQFALFTSLAAVPRTVVNASTGYLVAWCGWQNFFWLCTVLAIPGMVLLLKVAPWKADIENKKIN